MRTLTSALLVSAVLLLSSAASAHAYGFNPPPPQVSLNVDAVAPVTAKLSTGKVSDPNVTFTVTAGTAAPPYRVNGCVTSYTYAVKCRAHVLAPGQYTMSLFALTGMRLSIAQVLPGVDLRSLGVITLPTFMSYRYVW